MKTKKLHPFESGMATIEEIVQVTGCPESLVRRAIKDGANNAIDIRRMRIAGITAQRSTSGRKSQALQYGSRQ